MPLSIVGTGNVKYWEWRFVLDQALKYLLCNSYIAIIWLLCVPVLKCFYPGSTLYTEN